MRIKRIAISAQGEKMGWKGKRLEGKMAKILEVYINIGRESGHEVVKDGDGQRRKVLKIPKFLI